MTGGRPHSEPVLTQDLWQLLFTQALLFATKYINRLRWRGDFGGVLPDGDDAESIATQAVIDFLNGLTILPRPWSEIPIYRGRGEGRGEGAVAPTLSETSSQTSSKPPSSKTTEFPVVPIENQNSKIENANTLPLPIRGGEGRGEGAVFSCAHSLQVREEGAAARPLPRSITSALSRLVWRHVDRLHHRSENLLLRNEADLAPVYLDDGEVCSFIETIPDPGGNPYDNLVHKETTAEFESLQTDFRKFLGPEQRLKSLFTCYANGIWRPRDVATRLHLPVAATRNLQKRLKRRLHHFLEQRSHAE